MLTELCAEIRNYFCQDADKHFGKFKISGGALEPLTFLKDGQFFRIVGSTFNDGVYQYPCDSLTDEDFEGAVWAMAVPPSVIALSEKIEQYTENDKPSAYTSESFGGYSYSKATDANGAPITWQKVFANDLKKWRKL